LEQMFGPGAAQAVETYRGTPGDRDLAGLLALFGSTPMRVPAWKRMEDKVFALDDSGKEIAQVPLKEPVHIRTAFDATYGVPRTNMP